MENEITDDFLNLAQVAELLRVSERTVTNMIARGSLPTPALFGGKEQRSKREILVIRDAMVAGRSADEIRELSLELQRRRPGSASIATLASRVYPKAQPRRVASAT